MSRFEKITASIASTEPSWKGDFFLDHETGMKYRCLIGGFAWPGIKPGFLVVLGIDYECDPRLKLPKMHCLAEFENDGAEALIQKALQLRQDFSAHFWYGDSKSPMREFISAVNLRRQKQKEWNFSLFEPPHLLEEGAFGYYARMVGSQMRSGAKLLFLDECVKLKGYIDNFPAEAAAIGTAIEYPAVAALGYAVTAVRSRRPWYLFGGLGTIDENDDEVGISPEV